MDYVVVEAACAAAYAAKQAVWRAMDGTREPLPDLDKLGKDERLDVSWQAAAAIAGDPVKGKIARVGWNDPERVFWLVARIVARAMSHEVLDNDPLVRE